MDSRTIVWIDASGVQTATRINSSAGAGGIQTALLNASEADFSEWWEGTLNSNVTPLPPGGPYRPVAQRAALIFLCADNTNVALLLPSPALAIFKADGETVDPANGLVAAIVAACVGSLTNKAGSLATSFVAGHLLPLSRTPL